MSWNRNREEVANRERTERPTSGWRGRRLICGGICALVGCAVLLCIFLCRTSPQPSDARPTADSRLIKTVQHVVQTNASPVKAKDPHEGFVLSSKGVWQPADRPYWAGATKVHAVVTNRLRRSRAVRSATDQVLLDIFSRAPGDMPAPLPAALPQRDVERMAEILLDTHPDKDGKDSEIDRLNKETLRRAKQEARKFIKEGGTIEEFIRHYHKELTSAYQERSFAQRHVAKICHEGESGEVVSEMVKAINKKLQDRGIKPIYCPTIIRKE